MPIVSQYRAVRRGSVFKRHGYSDIPGSVVTTPQPSSVLMGCSTSNNDHGGTEEWAGWRTYTRNELYNYVNRTGAQRPTFMAYSEQGAPFSGSYASIYSHVRDELDIFYYGSVGGTTPHARTGIKLYWSNGNENSDKGMLANQTPANIDLYVTSQQALWDAVHYETSPGVRKYPDAYAGSNPTQEHERVGIVASWLHPSARYHDFVMWSMYPPGRGVNDPVLAVDPRFDWPSFDEGLRLNRQQGYLLRCFYRTKQAEAQARIDLADPDYRLAVGTGEVGIASDPDDNTQRPYYTARALACSMWLLSLQYDLDFPFACWWDNKTSDTAPHNVLTDEPPTSDHGGTGTTNPTTRDAWVNWYTYDTRVGGNPPTSWASNPKASWNTTGPVV